MHAQPPEREKAKLFSTRSSDSFLLATANVFTKHSLKDFRLLKCKSSLEKQRCDTSSKIPVGTQNAHPLGGEWWFGKSTKNSSFRPVLVVKAPLYFRNWCSFNQRCPHSFTYFIAQKRALGKDLYTPPPFNIQLCIRWTSDIN